MTLTNAQMRPFFLYAREREAIRVRREEEKMPRPWTSDPILGYYRFCNVYREDDRTTRWFRQHVRGPMSSMPEVLLATVLFRWFNRTTTGEAMFLQRGDYTGDFSGKIRTAWEQYLLDKRTESLKTAIVRHCGKGPYVTGAYIVKTPTGVSKLDGVLSCLERFREQTSWLQHAPRGWAAKREHMDWYEASTKIMDGRISCTMEQMWQWLKNFPYLGDFTAYEIVTDLRHTRLLSDAPDIYTWANPGPGAMRGLNRLYGRSVYHAQPKSVFVYEMRKLLWRAEERDSMWPHREGQKVEMRDIEHTLCEFDKYERVRLGQGKPKGTF